jgi:putative ABC transport system permease protein
VIDEKIADQMWPEEEPIGKAMQIVRFDMESMSLKRMPVQVVGLVEHVRSESLTKDGRGAIFYPYRFFPWWPMVVTVRATGDPAVMAGAIRSEVSAIDPDVPIADVRAMDDYVSRAMAQSRFTLTLIAVFAAIALILASIGLYGVISYSLRQRVQEIGVRVAFGAGSRSIVQLILRHGLILAVTGVVLGLGVAVVVTRMASSLLFGVTPTDPATFIGVPLLLVAVAALASYIPARRATRIDPVHALRGNSR